MNMFHGFGFIKNLPDNGEAQIMAQDGFEPEHWKPLVVEFKGNAKLEEKMAQFFPDDYVEFQGHGLRTEVTQVKDRPDEYRMFMCGRLTDIQLRSNLFPAEDGDGTSGPRMRPDYHAAQKQATANRRRAEEEEEAAKKCKTADSADSYGPRM